MLFDLCGVLFITLILSLFFTLSGSIIYNISIPDNDRHPISFKYGFSYFLGMSFFIVIYKITAFLTDNAKVALAISLITLVYIGSLKLKKLSVRKIRPFLNYKLASLFIVVPFFPIIQWLPNGIYPLCREYSVGSLHTGIYANIATYIMESNSIPRLNQNYGQSILSSVPLLAGFNNPYLSLYIWLTVSIIALIATFYGFLKLFSLNNSTAALGTFMLMFGNTALSLVKVQVLDSMSPLIFNGYTDTIASLGSFLGFLVWFHTYYISRDKISGYKNLLLISLIPIILGIGWNLHAPQNIIMGCLIIVSTLFISFYKNIACSGIKSNEWKSVSVVTLIFCSAIGIGATQGGMLTPRSIAEADDLIPGIRTPYTEEGYTTISPIFPFGVDKVDSYEIGDFIRKEYFTNRNYRYAFKLHLRDNFFWNLIYNKNPNIGKPSIRNITLRKIIWKFEVNLWESIRVIFFPMLGIIMLGLIVFAGKIKVKFNDKNVICFERNELLKLKNFLFAGVASFGTGYVIAFFLVFSGYKWELSRFLTPGYSLGMISLIISVNLFTNRFKSIRVLTWVFLAFLITAGQIIHIIPFASNTINSTTPFIDRIRVLVQTNGIIRCR